MRQTIAMTGATVLKEIALKWVWAGARSFDKNQNKAALKASSSNYGQTVFEFPTFAGDIMVEVIVAEPNPLLRLGLEAVLEDTADIAIVDQVDTGEQLLAAMRDVRHHVALVGLGLLRDIGVVRFREARRIKPECGVLVHSYEWEPDFGIHAARFGASGYFSHECTAADLRAAVVDVAAGKPFITRSLGAEVATAACFRAGVLQQAPLTTRERYISMMLAIGIAPRGIAAQLGIRIEDVVAYKWKIMAKTEVPGAGELVRHAIAQARRDRPWPGGGHTGA
jgi:DNA-binding NarL/FixJ family response regulator